MTQPTFLDGIGEHEPKWEADVLAEFPQDITRNRHRDSPESIAANPSETAKRESHEKILALFDLGHWTGKEVAEALHKPFNAVSGRVSELRMLGKLVKTGERRDGGAILRKV